MYVNIAPITGVFVYLLLSAVVVFVFLCICVGVMMYIHFHVLFDVLYLFQYFLFYGLMGICLSACIDS
jgi:hypothetical protein